VIKVVELAGKVALGYDRILAIIPAWNHGMAEEWRRRSGFRPCPRQSLDRQD